LALETGMRRGELYALEWDRVDLKRRQLLLLMTKNGTSRAVILTEKQLKGFRNCRSVGLMKPRRFASPDTGSRWYLRVHGLSLSWRRP